MSVNRSEEIRRFYDQNPGARPKECIIALAAQGIDVSPTLVSCVRAKLREVVPERDIASDVCVVRGFMESSGLDLEVAVEILGRFAGVVEKVGGLERFREVLEVVSAEDEVDIVDAFAANRQRRDSVVEVKAPVGEVPVKVPEITAVAFVVPVKVPEVSPVASSGGFIYDDVNDEDDD